MRRERRLFFVSRSPVGLKWLNPAKPRCQRRDKNTPDLFRTIEISHCVEHCTIRCLHFERLPSVERFPSDSTAALNVTLPWTGGGHVAAHRAVNSRPSGTNDVPAGREVKSCNRASYFPVACYPLWLTACWKCQRFLWRWQNTFNVDLPHSRWNWFKTSGGYYYFFASLKFFLTAIKTLSGFETTNWTSRRVGSGAVALCDATKSSFAEMSKQENKVRDGLFPPCFSHIFSASSVTGWRTRIALNNIAEADFTQCRTF